MMKCFICGLLAFLILPAGVQALELDRVVAVVGDEAVTASELNQRVSIAERQLRGQGTALPAPSQLRQQVLERLVLDRVQLQRAKLMGIAVDDAMLDRALQRIAEQNRLKLAELPKAVEQEGLSWQGYRENVRNEIVLSRLREREVDSKISITEAEVDAVLNASDSASKGREYLLSHIFLRAPESATPEQWMALATRAEDLMKQIRAGEDFGKLAASYSASQDAMQGGVMAWSTLERIPAIFADQLEGMSKGDVSKILRSASGMHVFKLLDVRELAEKKVEIEKTHARHILIRTADVGSESQAVRRLEELAQRIRNGADFAELAKANSSDITSAKGGDLGWMVPGENVPEFDRAMNALKPGELSGVVATPFGWHLIQVLERKVFDVTEDRRKLEARQAVRERKLDEAYEDWLRQLRDSTYVEIKPE